MSDIQHAIKAVAQRTGLSPHVIRVWEKRYGVVRPTRTGTNRRLYSEEEVQRLELLRHATQSGHNISQAARLSNEKLRELVLGATVTGALPASARDVSRELPTTPAAGAVQECLDHVRNLDAQGLEAALQRAAVQFGHLGFLNRVVAPLSQQVGELWRTGEVTAAHEHFLSAALRTFLGRGTRQFALTDTAPVLVIATPAGQLHELGAVMVNAAAANLGWRATYLGTSLPAAEIAGAAIQNKARAVALSIVYPEDDENVSVELSNLRRYLPPEIRILCGGRACDAYREVLTRIGAVRAGTLAELGTALDELRRPTGRG
jgi:DNA-binding transcriptional MerR regulator/methylmalonyl-CoA mutase cobalamin-binding subunit